MKRYMVIIVMEDKSVKVRFYESITALRRYASHMLNEGAISAELYVRGPWGYERTNMADEFSY